MMKKSVMDIATDKLHERMNLVNQKLVTMYKDVKPYRAEPVPMDIQKQVFLNQGYEMFKNIADTQGIKEAVKWRDKMIKETGGQDART